MTNTITTQMANAPTPDLARQMANAIRMLAVDAVEKAKSQATPVPPWAWPILPRCCGIAISSTTPANRTLARSRPLCA